MTDTFQQALDTPGCERLRDFAAVGPAQRAALELFVDRLRAAEGKPVAWMHPEWRNYTRAPPPSRTPQEGWTALYTSPPKAAQMSEEEIRELSAKHIKSGMFKGAPATWGIVDFAREIEAKYGVKRV